ncbi:MAG: LicD family protein [Prevotella sp.]|jgi:lipopolysaccharide cholinephosphotransferase|nr:LicD family protein [Prevotella sp.]
MPTYDVKPLQARLLNILLTFDNVCREQHLNYYITGGTLLGAVRHRGFIPWDDDLDIAMPRPDYEWLIAHAKDCLPQPLEFVCAENDANYFFPFAKIQDAGTTLIERRGFNTLGGIYIDVFPLDGVPQGKTTQKLHFARYRLLTKLLYLTCRDPKKHKKGLGSFVPFLCRQLFTPAAIQQSIRKLLLKYDYDRSSLAADYDDRQRGVMDKKVFGTPSPIMFEEKEVWGMERPAVYLEKKYGDYMQIPAVEQQIQHNFSHIDLDKPYREYKRP